MRFWAFAAGGFLACSLGACSGSLSGQAGDDFVKLTSFYDYGASGRDLLLTVSGDPYGMPDNAFAKAVERAVQVQVIRPRSHPTLTPDSSARSGYSVVFVFQPAKTLQGDAVCQNHIEHQSAASSSVLAAFCVSGRALTEISGDIDATSTGDPRFGDLMAQIMLALFRPDLPDSGDSPSGR